MASTSPSRPRRNRGINRYRQGGWWQFLIPIATAAIGALTGRNAAKSAEAGQRETNATNIALARENMEFQREMSSTAYQRGTEDMKQAGLNPMLAYSQGGASAPAGSLARVDNPKSQSSQIQAQAYTSSAAQAMQVAGAMQTMQQQDAQTELYKAQATKAQSETLSQDLHTANLAAEVKQRQGQSEITEIERWLKDGTRAWSAKQIMAEADSKEYAARRDEDSFQADVRRRKAESLTSESESRIRHSEESEAKSTSDFFNKAQSFPKWLQLLLPLVNHIRPGR